MTIMRPVIIKCDQCGREVRKNDNLNELEFRRLLTKSGWKFREKSLDLCPSCIPIAERREAVFPRDKP